jgi:glycyl-tRNA synthetase
MDNDALEAFIVEHKLVCPVCGISDFTSIRKFNLMFKTFQGVTEDSANTVYLRPETAQGIFVNFANVQRSSRLRVPFGIGQIGKSFRNEITPGNFTFRTREFEQMELEFFCKPGTDLEWFAYWKDYCHQFLLDLGMKDENLRLRDHDPEELCFYSKATTDFEFLFPFGWGELWGVADRTDYDLGQHQKHSGKDLTYFDQETGEHYIPYVIEPSLGADRVALAFLVDAYDEEVIDEAKNDVRTVLHLHPALAPFKAAVLPLSKKLSEKAGEIYDELSKYFMIDYDETGSIGKRYRREDEIGTPLCITVDFETVGDDTKEADNCVTVRDRDTMEQVRIPIAELKSYIEKKIQF